MNFFLELNDLHITCFVFPHNSVVRHEAACVIVVLVMPLMNFMKFSQTLYSTILKQPLFPQLPSEKKNTYYQLTY